MCSVLNVLIMFQVFQPLLMEYFTFEELKEIKARVLHLHSVFKEVYKKSWYISAVNKGR